MCETFIDKGKRNLLKGILVYTPLITFSNYALSDNKFMLDNPLAGSVYYTKYKPGRWKSISASHLPTIKKDNDLIEVSTAHEMRGFEHYILKHLVLDNKLRIISEKLFDPSKDAPMSTHNISGYQGPLFILSVCNLHDTWLTSYEIK